MADITYDIDKLKKAKKAEAIIKKIIFFFKSTSPIPGFVSPRSISLTVIQDLHL